MIADYGRAHGIAHVSFRYFNVAGADPEAEIGEDPVAALDPGTVQQIRQVAEAAVHEGEPARVPIRESIPRDLQGVGIPIDGHHSTQVPSGR